MISNMDIKISLSAMLYPEPALFYHFHFFKEDNFSKFSRIWRKSIDNSPAWVYNTFRSD